MKERGLLFFYSEDLCFFFSCFSARFSFVVFAGFFLTSFLAFCDFPIVVRNKFFKVRESFCQISQVEEEEKSIKRIMYGRKKRKETGVGISPFSNLRKKAKFVLTIHHPFLSHPGRILLTSRCTICYEKPMFLCLHLCEPQHIFYGSNNNALLNDNSRRNCGWPAGSFQNDRGKWGNYIILNMSRYL